MSPAKRLRITPAGDPTVDQKSMTSPGDDALVARASFASNWSVLANGRLGLPLPAMKGGKQIYLSTDLKTRLCEHGETASLISQWSCTPPQLARPAHSKCTCYNVDGLTASRFSPPPKGWTVFDVPSYFDVLVSSNAKEKILQGGRVARQLLHIPGAFMLSTGGVRCAHGNSVCTLRAIEKSKLGHGKHTIRSPCDCKIGLHPWRATRLQTAKGKRSL